MIKNNLFVGLTQKKQKIIKQLKSKQAVSSAWAFIGLAGPTFLQLIYMIVAARILGAEQTGNFFLIVSVALIGSAFVGFGAGGIVLRDTARCPQDANKIFSKALAVSLTTFPLILPIIIFIAWMVTKGDVSIWVIFLIVVSDLFAARIMTTIWSLFIALERHIHASLLICTLPLSRFVAVILVIMWPEEQHFEVFALFYFFSSFIALIGVLFLVRHQIGNYVLTIKNYDYRSGFSFSLTWLNSALQTESDKILLGLFSSPATVALYGIASRLMDGAAMPPRALRVSMQSRLFREGKNGHLTPYKITLRMLPFVIIYGLVIWLLFWISAPFFVWIFGEEFSGLSYILPILGILPLLRAISDYGAEIFMASDKPQVQALTQTIATILRIGLGIILINAFLVEGAVATTLLITFTTGAFLWYLAWKYSRR